MKKYILSPPYPLSGARYLIRRAGQEDPANGDRVVVEAFVLLRAVPVCSSGGLTLDPKLRFGARVKIAGSELREWTGKHPNDIHPPLPRLPGKFLAYPNSFTAEKWATALAQAEAWAQAEISKLEEALAKRKAARKAAEN
jgi:hypothetical protein